MAIVTRRYQFIGPSLTDLTTFVSPTAFVAAIFQGPIVDISVDNAMPGVVDALDDYMATLKYVFNPAALKPPTAIIPYAPLAPVGFGIVTCVAFGGLAASDDAANWPAPRETVLENLQIDVTANSLTVNTEFIIRVAVGIGAFADTLLVVNVPANTTGTFSVAGSIPLGVGDRVALRVTTGGVAGSITFTGSVDGR